MASSTNDSICSGTLQFFFVFALSTSSSPTSISVSLIFIFIRWILLFFRPLQKCSRETATEMQWQWHWWWQTAASSRQHPSHKSNFQVFDRVFFYVCCLPLENFNSFCNFNFGPNEPNIEWIALITSASSAQSVCLREKCRCAKSVILDSDSQKKHTRRNE